MGVPLPDMGTSEHGYGLLMKALLKRQIEGVGSRIELSMFDSSVSWLTVPICLSATFGKQITRHGNAHEFFCPVNVYETKDGFIYLAVGNDKQWKSMVSQPEFQSLNQPVYEQNSGRISDGPNIHAAIGAITRQLPSSEWIDLFYAIGVPVSKINTITEVIEDPVLEKKLLHSVDPVSNMKITLAPPPCETPFIAESDGNLTFPPRFGEHNEAIFGELGYSKADLVRLKEKGVI
jgi:formyl-CoA transferase